MKKLTLIITTLVAIGISGCKKSFLNESVNPNAPSSSSLALTLSSAEKGAADIPNGWGSYTATNNLYAQYGVWGGYWANPTGYIASAALLDYQITTNTTFSWADLYDNLANLNILETQSTGTDADYEAIAKILKAYDFEQLVDNYNNIPYSQAFKGSSNLTPTYDTGASVYADLIKQLDAAIVLINSNPNAIAPTTDDIIYQGNMANWKKFANSLKLRLIIRQSNTSTFSTIAADIATTSAEGYLDGTTAATANPGYNLSDSYGGQESPFYREYGIKPNGTTTTYGNSYYLANAFVVGLMNGLQDTLRLKSFYVPINGSTSSTQVIGAVLGGNIPPLTSKIGTALLNASQNAVLMSGNESLLLQAEAVYRGVMPGNAQALYEAAITSSFEQLGLTDAQAQAYFSQATPNAGWAASTNKIQAIITQKYIALNGFGVLEAYNEYRRTGFPNIPASVDGSVLGGGLLPARVFYPQIEYSTNPVNVGAQAPPTTATEFNSKIFWAK